MKSSDMWELKQAVLNGDTKITMNELISIAISQAEDEFSGLKPELQVYCRCRKRIPLQRFIYLQNHWEDLSKRERAILIKYLRIPRQLFKVCWRRQVEERLTHKAALQDKQFLANVESIVNPPRFPGATFYGSSN